MSKNLTVVYNRKEIENILRPMLMWLEIKVTDPLTADPMDRQGYLLTTIYEALSDFLLGYSQNILDRNFDTICEQYFGYNYDVEHPRQINQFFSEMVYPRFESVAILLSGGIRACNAELAKHDHEPESLFFYHQDSNTGVLVVQGIEVSLNDELV